MKKLYKPLFLSVAFLFSVSPVSALALSLEDWIFNVDGGISEDFNGDALPAQGNLVDGLGTYSLSVTGQGAHNVIGFFDFEMYEDTNTFFNESASVHGAAAAGQSWEVDEPALFGDIVDNVFIGSLQNHNAVTAGLEDDVSFAMGWEFNLLDIETATIDFVFTDILPTTAGFYITQLDPDLSESFYFYSTLTIEGSGVSVPEPSSMSLMGLFIIAWMLLAGKSVVRRFANDKGMAV